MGKTLDLPVAEIADRYRAGEPLRALALHYGASVTTIRRLVREAGVEMRPSGNPDALRRRSKPKGRRQVPVAPTGQPCAREGCDKPALGDEWCSRKCLALAFGLPWTEGKKLVTLDELAESA